MKITIEFLTNPKCEDESFRHEIALLNERGQKIAAKYGIHVSKDNQHDVEKIIRWAFIHGSYERALELKRLLEISPYIREVAEGEFLRPHGDDLPG